MLELLDTNRRFIRTYLTFFFCLELNIWKINLSVDQNRRQSCFDGSCDARAQYQNFHWMNTPTEFIGFESPKNGSGWNGEMQKSLVSFSRRNFHVFWKPWSIRVQRIWELSFTSKISGKYATTLIQRLVPQQSVLTCLLLLRFSSTTGASAPLSRSNTKIKSLQKKWSN